MNTETKKLKGQKLNLLQENTMTPCSQHLQSLKELSPKVLKTQAAENIKISNEICE